MSLNISKSDGADEKLGMESALGKGATEKVQALKDLIISSVGDRRTEVIKADNDIMMQGITGVVIDQYVPGRSAKPGDERLFAAKLYQSGIRMEEFGGIVLKQIVEYNFPIESFSEEVRDNDGYLQVEIDKLNDLVDDELPVPNRQMLVEDARCIKNAEERKRWIAARTVVSTGKTKGKSSQDTPGKAEPLVSEEYNIETDNAWKEHLESVHIDLLTNFGLIYARYEKNQADIKKSKKTREKLTKEKGKVVCISSRLKGYQAAVNIICNKMVEAIDRCAAVKRAVSMRVTLVVSGEEVTDPFQLRNLCGIMQLLLVNYSKANFVTFNQTLLSTIAFKVDHRVTSSDPLSVVVQVCNMLSMWEAMDYWIYMTKDIFFSAVLINAMSDTSDMKEKVMLKANEYMSLLDQREGEGDDDMSVSIVSKKSSELPIFKHICEYIRIVQESALKKSEAPPQLSQQTTPPLPPTAPHRNNRGWESRGSERAAMGEETSAATKFVHEVTRKDKVSKKFTNAKGAVKEVIYTATKAICAGCYAQGKTPHEPKCWSKTCDVCGLYGHTSKICSQDAKTFIRPPERKAAVDYGALADETQEDEEDA